MESFSDGNDGSVVNDDDDDNNRANRYSYINSVESI